MSRPASQRLVSRQTQRLAGRVGSIELLGGWLRLALADFSYQMEYP